MRQRLLTSENRKWWTLASTALGLLMIVLDNTIVDVALPSIQRDLGAKLSDLEWIFSGYALSFAALILATTRNHVEREPGDALINRLAA